MTFSPIFITSLQLVSAGPTPFQVWLQLLAKHIHKIFYEHLLVNPQDRRLLIAENPFWPHAFKSALATVLFELQIPAVLFLPGCALPMYAVGEPTGLVVDIGYSESRVLPVCDGFPIDSALGAVPLGLRAVYDRFRELRKDANALPGAGSGLHGTGLGSGSSSGSESGSGSLESKDPTGTDTVELLLQDELVVENIVARTCFVRPVPAVTAGSGSGSGSAEAEAEAKTSEWSAARCAVGGAAGVLVSGAARARAADALFGDNPEALSLAETVADTLIKATSDVRTAVVRNLVICGGGAHMPGLKARLLTEVNNLIATQPKYADAKVLHNKIRLVNLPFPPNCLAWVGASLTGATGVSKRHYLTREQFEARGGQVPDWTAAGSAVAYGALTGLFAPLAVHAGTPDLASNVSPPASPASRDLAARRRKAHDAEQARTARAKTRLSQAQAQAASITGNTSTSTGLGLGMGVDATAEPDLESEPDAYADGAEMESF